MDTAGWRRRATRQHRRPSNSTSTTMMTSAGASAIDAGNTPLASTREVGLIDHGGRSSVAQ
jgi:hypothetical protein